MVSIITPTTTGGLNYLVDLVPTIEAQTYKHEFILVDNNSRDGTANYMGNHECLLKVNTVKMNFSESNNYAAKVAQGNYLLFLNNDTKLEPNLLEEMVKTFDIDPKIAIVGCQLRLMRNPHSVHHAGIMFTEKYEPYELGLEQPFGVPALPKNDERVWSVREVPAVTSACMMMRKDYFFDIGGFNPSFIFGWEDVDINLRARQKGYKIYYNGKSWAYHHHFGSKDRGRFVHESENRKLYETLWMDNGKAKEVLNGFRQG